MRATMYGCEIVWPCPIGSAVSSYARLESASSTNKWRGTLRMRSSTASFVMPCSRRRAISRSRVRAEVMPMPLTRVLVPHVAKPARGVHSVRPRNHSSMSAMAVWRVRSTCKGVTDT